MHLSSVIVQRGIASIREVEEALAWQVLNGGDLVTNLLEVSNASESSLVTTAGEVFGLEPWPAGELPRARQEAMALIAPEVASAYNFFPLSVDRSGLVIAVAEPLPRQTEEELAFTLAMPIRARLAALVRIREALARDYGTPLDKRFRQILSRLRGESDSFSSVDSAPQAAPAVKEPPRPPSPWPSAPPPSLPRGATSAPPTLVRNIDVARARPRPRRRGPLTSESAFAELDKATERDAIFDLIFDFARQFFDYTVLFTVHGDVAEGRDAHGNGASRARVARIAVPLDQSSILQLARDQRTLVVKAPANTGIDALLAKDLRRLRGTPCVVVPAVVRGRVVALLFGDGGEDGIDATSLSETKRLIDKSAGAFERVIVRKKLADRTTASQSDKPKATTSGEVSAVAVQPARPSIEELAAPVRELLNDPNLARVEPSADAATPEEESPSSSAPVTLLSAHEPSTSDVAPRRRSSRPRRSSAPPLEFSAKQPPAPRIDGDIHAGVEHRMTSEIEGRDDLGKPSPLFPPLDLDDAVPISVDDDLDKTPLLPVVEIDATPVAPRVAVAQKPRTSLDVAPLVPPSPPTPDKRPMPASEQQISVAPHRPPASHIEAMPLPSVIVDVVGEYTACVDRVIAGNDDDAEATLMRAGGYAMPSIMAKFPGSLTLDAAHLADEPLPRVAECGPVLRLLTRMRRAALPFVLSHVDDPIVENRFWSTYLLTELVYPDAVEPALTRIFDDDASVRRAARAAARALSEVNPALVVKGLEAVATNRAMSSTRRRLAIEALGEAHEALAVSVLIPLVADSVPEIVTSAHDALVALTRQDFGDSRVRWQAWWDQNRARERLEWLIDALMHDEVALRAAAGRELRTITKEYFGYHHEASKRERERAQARYREWWNTVGRVRFSRSSRR
ncbi:MAG: hypothetical protein FWD69_06090 [Polyangiaceae bacterium]|nr:hypothetical protein [Polyangiaceae bacterium]